jgi:uncharacterized radical SAM superfamily Fe-S cluster-containing enzyme
MRKNSDIIRHTASVCPVCLKRINAQLVKRDSGVFMEKDCPEHGHFSNIVWRDRRDMLEWIGSAPEIQPGENLLCPNCSGICSEHKSDTCCVLLEVTGKCNLKCKFCFADKDVSELPTLEQLREEIKRFVVPGKTLVQLSGGEPTVRDDLPEIIRIAKESGCRYVQLNSNGIRLAEESDFVQKLADAGLSFVFMQFDSLRDSAYETLRGRPMIDIKRRAIQNCARCNIGVTLVPTLVPGVNTYDIGNIIMFAVANSPAVRGVHFQPVTYMGRIPDEPDDAARFTLDELMYQIEAQTGGMVKMVNLFPSHCDHPLCGFHGDFVVKEDRTLYPLSTKREDAPSCCCGSDNPADKNREFVARRWQRGKADEAACCSQNASDMTDMDYFLDRVKTHGFTITSMYFQDAGNLDIERLRQCSLHVFAGGRLVPFCAHYLTKWQ